LRPSVTAELAQLPLVDLISADLQAAVAEPGSDSWARLRAHAYATDRSTTDVARDILDRRLRLEAK